MKKCSKCGKEKDETEFYKNKRAKDGLRYDCKLCHNITRDDWQRRNPESSIKSCKKYYEAHKENWQIREKNMSEEQREKKRIYCREYCKNNMGRIRERKRERYVSIPTVERRKYSQKYYEAHKEEVCKRSRENYKNLSDEQKKENAERTRIWRKKNRQKMCAWSAVGNALVKGDMVKPNICERCNDSRSRIHAHHEDYDKPLEVTWLCHACHMNTHRMKNKI